jgi:hypothetical protein
MSEAMRMHTVCFIQNIVGSTLGASPFSINASSALRISSNAPPTGNSITMACTGSGTNDSSCSMDRCHGRSRSGIPATHLVVETKDVNKFGTGLEKADLVRPLETPVMTTIRIRGERLRTEFMTYGIAELDKPPHSSVQAPHLWVAFKWNPALIRHDS